MFYWCFYYKALFHKSSDKIIRYVYSDKRLQCRHFSSHFAERFSTTETDWFVNTHLGHRGNCRHEVHTWIGKFTLWHGNSLSSALPFPSRTRCKHKLCLEMEAYNCPDCRATQRKDGCTQTHHGKFQSYMPTTPP